MGSSGGFVRSLAAAALAALAAGCAGMGGGAHGDWEAVLQVGTGAQGGHASILRLDGAVYRLHPTGAEDPLPFREVPSPHDPPRWYLRADRIPAGSVLAVEGIDFAAVAPGDTNGHGEIRLVFPSGEAVRIVDESGPYRVWFEGRALVTAGSAPNVFLEAANSSCADVRLTGRLLSAEEAAGLSAIPFEAASDDRAPAERVGGKLGLVRPWRMEEPRALLQARAGAVGGNPVRVTLLGRGSNAVRRLVPNPISTSRTPHMKDEAIGYCGGGRIPPGKVWVVTRISYEGNAAGDTNGPGEFLLQVGETVLARSTRDEKVVKGVWEGRLELHPGQEREVFLQIRNSSTGSATFEGTFE